MAKLYASIWGIAMVLLVVEYILMIVNLIRKRDRKMTLLMFGGISVLFALELYNVFTLDAAGWAKRFEEMNLNMLIGLLCIAVGCGVYILCYKKGVVDITPDDEIDMSEYRRAHDPKRLEKQKQREEARKIRQKQKL